ncbi:MAG: hypothetical protein AB1938_13890 [Myxococcota bacterium]
MRPHRVTWLAVLVVLLGAREALTSESHDEISLEDVVRRSTVIAVVEPATPPTKESKVPIGGKHPPYERTQHRLVVKEVLSNRAGTKLPVGKTIEVDVGDYDTRLTVHRRYYLEGVRKSPIYSYYRPAPVVDGGASSPQEIVFLVRSGDGWEFTASGARERLERRAAIEALLAKTGD